MSYEWVLKLNESNSRLHKEAVVRQAYTAATIGDEAAIRFLEYAHATYSAYITFGVKQVPTSTNTTVSDADTNWAKFSKLLADLNTRCLTGHAARDAIVETMDQMSAAAWNNLARLVLIKDLRAGCTDTTFNKILRGTRFEIPIFECQLASDVHKISGAVQGVKHLEVKLDGVRVLAMVTPESVTLYSRNGLVFENFEHVAEELHSILWSRVVAAFPAAMVAEGVVFDGEVVSKTFNSLMKQARRKKGAKVTDSVYHIFDMVPLADFRRGYYNTPQKTRAKHLSRVLPANFLAAEHLKLVPHLVVDYDTAEGRETADRFMADSVAAGFEGIMIKDADAPYESKRGTFWLKQKPWIEVSLTVTGVEEGTGKHAGRLGALLCRGIEDGKDIQVSVGGGFSDKQRNEFFKYRDQIVGCIAEVRADSISQNQDGTYSLRFPRFKTMRGFEQGEKL